MAAPITPPLAINPIITIQPVQTAVSGREFTGQQALLALMADGSVVRGFVINRDQKNNPIIRTPSGDFVVESEGIFIKTGSSIAFKVDSSQPSLARIVTIDDQSPEAYSTQNIRAGLAEDTIARPQLGTLTQTARAGGQPVSLPLLQAVVLQALTTSQAPAQAIPPALNQLSPGTPLNVTVYDVKLPPIPVSVASMPAAANLSSLLPGATSGNPPAPLPSSIAAPLAAAFFAFEKAQNLPSGPAMQALPQPPAQQTAPQTSPASQGMPTAPAQPQPQTVSVPPGQTAFTATVIGHGEDGSNIIHTPFASLKIFTAQPLPSNTTLTITAETGVTSMQAIPVAQAPIAPPPLPVPPSFNYLGPALAQLMASDPSIARELMTQLPVVGHRFTSGLLFFLAAVKSGDRRGAFSALEMGRMENTAPGLLSQFNRDIRELHQAFVNPPFDEWRPVHLPLVFGSQVETARLYVRREPDESAAKAEKISGGNRFLLDLQLSELGDMQLDGFVRHGERGKSLELFLRSAKPLDANISQDIRGLFVNATEATGMAGNIVFQQGAEHFVKPQQKPTAPPGDSATHTILA